MGDDRHSWAFDGFRQKKWNKEDADYGSHTSNATTNATAVAVAAADKNTATAAAKGAAKKTASTSTTTATIAAAGGKGKGKGKNTTTQTAASAASSSSTTTSAAAAAAVDNDDEGPAPWQAGDVVGCLLSFSGASGKGTGASMSYTVNGVSLGEAYSCRDTAAVMTMVQNDYEKVEREGTEQRVLRSG